MIKHHVGRENESETDAAILRIHGDTSRLPSTSVQVVPHSSTDLTQVTSDIVDTFAQLDKEQLEILDNALASEQAKQILGENVTAMLDSLSADDIGLKIRRLIKCIQLEHCYANIPHSDDLDKSTTLKTNVTSKPQPSNLTTRKLPSTSRTPRQTKTTSRAELDPKNKGKQKRQILIPSGANYDFPTGVPFVKSPQKKSKDPDYKEADWDDSDSDRISDEDYVEESTRKKGSRASKTKKPIFSKVGSHKNIKRLKEGGIKFSKTDSNLLKKAENINALPKTDVETPPPEQQKPKYPKRENRKPPAHLMTSLGPALFSVPDIIKRVPAVDKLSLDSSKKTNPSVGVCTIVKEEKKTMERKRSLDEAVKPILKMEVQDLKPSTSRSLSPGTQLQMIFKTEGTVEPTFDEDDGDIKPTSLDITQMDQTLLADFPLKNEQELLEEAMENDLKNAREDVTYRSITKEVAKTNKPRQKQKVREVTKSKPKKVQKPLDIASYKPGDRKRNAAKRRRSDEVSDIETDNDSETSMNSEDDPTRLWCICQKPHHNRFMICCDSCTEWFHGKCVGISKATGNQMVEDGLEWTCPTCERLNMDETETPKKTGEPRERPRQCIMCKKLVRANSIYCSDDCIRKHSQAALRHIVRDKSADETSTSSKLNNEPAIDSPVVVMDLKSKKLLAGSQAPMLSNLTSWLKQNPSYQVVSGSSSNTDLEPNTTIIIESFASKKPKAQPAKTMSLPAQRKAPQVEHKTIKVISPTGQKKQSEMIQIQPAKMQLTKISEPPKISPKDETPAKRRRKEKLVARPEVKANQSLKTETTDAKESSKGKKEVGDQQVRESVRKALAETLKTKIRENGDKTEKDDDIENLVLKIEENLFKHFDCKLDAKYRAKYRSLLFNIKDTKNQTLYRKILEKSISPEELVKLSPDELASQELASWREKENQKELEMIKKTELELMMSGTTYITKSHKGELMIDTNDKITSVAVDIDPNTPAQELVSALNSASSSTPEDSKAEKKDGKSTRYHKTKDNDKKKSDRGKSRRRTRSRSRSRTRSHKSSKSRSRDRSRHKSSRRSDKKNKTEKEDISNMPPLDELVPSLKKMGLPSNIYSHEDEDREPSSTVTIVTPDSQNSLPAIIWQGRITMAEVAKFKVTAFEISSNCCNLDFALKYDVEICGRIPYDTVWNYVRRVQKIDSKDILVFKLLATDSSDRMEYIRFFNYLSKRSRIGVIKPTSVLIKDFYIYPLGSQAELPAALLPQCGIDEVRDNMLLGILIRNKTKSYYQEAESSNQTQTLNESFTSTTSQTYIPTAMTRYNEGASDHHHSRKVKVHVEVHHPASEDDDSPYNPSDEDEFSDMPYNESKPVSNIDEELPQDPVELEKRIQQMQTEIKEKYNKYKSLQPFLSASSSQVKGYQTGKADKGPKIPGINDEDEETNSSSINKKESTLSLLSDEDLIRKAEETENDIKTYQSYQTKKLQEDSNSQNDEPEECKSDTSEELSSSALAEMENILDNAKLGYDNSDSDESVDETPSPPKQMKNFDESKQEQDEIRNKSNDDSDSSRDDDSHNRRYSSGSDRRGRRRE